MDNCSRGTRNLTHFEVIFPQYYQLMLPYIVLHHLSPVYRDSPANTNSAILCQTFAVIFAVKMLHMYIL